MLAVIAEQRFHNVLAAFFLRLPPLVAVYARKHELPQAVHGFLHQRRHGQLRFVRAARHNVANHGVDALAVRLPQHLQAVRRQFKGLQDSGAQGIIQIVIQIRNPIGTADALPLQRCGKLLAGVTEDAVAHLPRQVQPVSVVLQRLDAAPRLLVVPEAFRH